MSDFEMKYKGSELEALVEGSASSLFYAGTIEAAYSIPGLSGAQVTVSDAFRTKYNIGENKEVFYIVDKRMTPVGDSNVLYIYPADFEGCYFVMGDFEGNDAILGLGAAKGDWVVVQGREWVKIATTQRDIAGISGEVTTEALAQKLSTPTQENTDPLAKASDLKDMVKGVTANGSTHYPNAKGVVDLSEIAQSETYVADFTMEDLFEGMNNGTEVQCNMQNLIAAMNANKVILVRESVDSSFKGVHVLNGYTEDLLYFSIVTTSGAILWCYGTDYSKAYINGRTLRLHSFNTKQDKLVSGENIKTINGNSILGSGNITIEGGGIAVETDPVFSASPAASITEEKKSEWDSKQAPLTLTVKNNGNIVIGNIAGQSKEFMPATPSGDPMHYYYLSHFGVTYNESTGFFELEYLKDLTANDMRNAVRVSSGNWSMLYNSASSVNAKIPLKFRPRTNIAIYSGDITAVEVEQPRWQTSLEQFIIGRESEFAKSTIVQTWTGASGFVLALAGLPALKYIVGNIDISTIPVNTLPTLFTMCDNIVECNLYKLNKSQIIRLEHLSKSSLQFLLQNRINTEEIALGLPESLYTKIMSPDGEWVDLLPLLEANDKYAKVVIELNA